MNAEIDEFLIPSIFIGAGLITFSICSLIRDRRETDAGDDMCLTFDEGSIEQVSVKA